MNGDFVTCLFNQSHQGHIMIILLKLWYSTWITFVPGCSIQVSLNLPSRYLKLSTIDVPLFITLTLTIIKSWIFQLPILLQFPLFCFLGNGVWNYYFISTLSWDLIADTLETRRVQPTHIIENLETNPRWTNTHCLFLHALFKCRLGRPFTRGIPCLPPTHESNDNRISRKLCEQETSKAHEDKMEEPVWSWTIEKFSASLWVETSHSCHDDSIVARTWIFTNSHTRR